MVLHNIIQSQNARADADAFDDGKRMGIALGGFYGFFGGVIAASLFIIVVVFA